MISSKSDAPAKNRTAGPILAPGIGRRIAASVKMLGTRKYAAEVMDVSGDALQRYMREENKPTFEALARLCLATGISMEWLATEEGEMLQAARLQAAPGNVSQSPRLDRETLRLAADVLEKALDSANASTDSAGRAELLVAIYELLEQGAARDAAERVVATMLRAASRAAGVPSKQG